MFDKPEEDDYDPYYSDAPFYLSDDGKTLSIDINKLPENFDFNELKSFDGIKELYISGHDLENIEFVKYFPETEVVHTYFTINDTEVLRPLTELPKLAVIVDSGHGSYLLEGLTKEERADLEELFANYLWTFIK